MLRFKPIALFAVFSAPKGASIPAQGIAWVVIKERVLSPERAI